MDAPRRPVAPTIQWVRPTVKLPLGQPLAFASNKFTGNASLLARTPPAIREALLTQGVPEVRSHLPFRLSARLEAIQLLQLAAEVEHALMVQYLYAHASLQGTSAYDIKVKNKIRTVAVQEMGHLLCVQNLLLAIGGPTAFYFGRDAIRANSLSRPIPLVLEPVSLQSLAKYVVAEMPAEVTDSGDNPNRVSQVKAIIESVKNTGIVPHQVGTLYTKLFWLFQPTDEPLAPFSLTPVSGMLPKGQHIKASDFTPLAEINQFMANDDWLQGSVPDLLLKPVTDNLSACELLASIAEQGEGQLGDEDSHFEHFLAIYNKLQVQVNTSAAGQQNLADKLTVTPLPTAPVASTPLAPDAAPGKPIAHPYLAGWADLADLRYNLLVTTLWQTMATPIAKRDAALTTFFNVMGLLAQTTQRLLAIRERIGDKTAGPPYALRYDYQTNPFAQHYQEMLTEQKALIQKIRGMTPHYNAAQDNPTLQNLEAGSVLPA